MFSKHLLVTTAVLLALASLARAEDDPADSDMTAVTNCCEGLPSSVTIVVMSKSDTIKVCREMMRVLEGVRHKDITMFEKFAYVMGRSGYEKDEIQIVRDAVEIIRLRGLYDKPDRWQATNEISHRSWVAFNGAIAPSDVISFLRGAGYMAKDIDDNGLTQMLIAMKRIHQRGD